MIVRDFYLDTQGQRDFNLYPIGDLQKGSEGFNESLWRRCAQQIKNDPSALFIGMGDYGDHWRPTNQAKLAGLTTSDKDFAASIDEMYGRYNQKLFETLAPVVKTGRCIGLLSGHHEFTYSTGLNSTVELCQRLNVPYLGRQCLVDVVFTDNTDIWTLRIHAQHGEGGSSYIGADVAHLEKKTFPNWTADLFLRGHSTKVYAFKLPRLTKTRPNRSRAARLIDHPIQCVNTGGFMKGYLEGNQTDAKETYVSRSNMSPAHLGYAVVHLHLGRHRATTAYSARQIEISVTH